MTNSYIHLTPIHTIIRDSHNDKRYLVSTAYYSEGFYHWHDLWETMVFPYYTNGDGEESVDFGDEYAQLRCTTYAEAIAQHSRLVEEFSSQLLPECLLR